MLWWFFEEKGYVGTKEFDNFIYVWPTYFREHWHVFNCLARHEDCLRDCFLNISICDYLFCFLDSNDSFGSIMEIWIAHALNKEIYIYYTDKVDRDDMWFVFSSADAVNQVSDYHEARKHFNEKILITLKNMDYKEYLTTDHRIKLSKERKEMDGNRCVLCNSTRYLNVHHRDYTHRGDYEEEIKDLITLCNKCHKKHHDIT